jgi:hypothetical protein
VLNKQAIPPFQTNPQSEQGLRVQKAMLLLQRYKL